MVHEGNQQNILLPWTCIVQLVLSNIGLEHWNSYFLEETKSSQLVGQAQSSNLSPSSKSCRSSCNHSQNLLQKAIEGFQVRVSIVTEAALFPRASWGSETPCVCACPSDPPKQCWARPQNPGQWLLGSTWRSHLNVWAPAWHITRYDVLNFKCKLSLSYAIFLISYMAYNI